jgi:hypothetical protein
MIYYGFQILQSELQERSLLHHRPFILSLEKEGHISIPQNKMQFHKADYSKRLSSKLIRIYTLDEIETICGQVETYMINRKKTKQEALAFRREQRQLRHQEEVAERKRLRALNK